jgi:two-component system response regulator ChvI
MTIASQAWKLQTVAPLATDGLPPDRVAKVVAVDGDEQFRRLLSDELTEQGFDITVFGSGAALLQAVESVAAADLLILDWNLGGMPAVELVPKLRAAGIDIPVVFVTGRPLMANEDRAFALGALDFIDKSRGFGILVRRLRLITRECLPKRQAAVQVEHGHLTLVPRAGRAFWKGEDVDLTLCEFKIVHLLVQSPARHVGYREIYDCMHYRGFVAGAGEDGYRVNVRSAIRRLRTKFRSFDAAFNEIENVASSGYAWRKNSDAAATL